MRARDPGRWMWNENQGGRPLGGLFRFRELYRAVPTPKAAGIVIKMLHSRHTRSEIVMLSPHLPGIGAATD